EAWENDEHLCDSCALAAASSQRLPTPATRESTVQNGAVPTTNGKAPRGRNGTSRLDTGCSDGLFPAGQEDGQNTCTSSSIGKSGKTPPGQCQRGSSSITSTETKQTPDLRTCNSCGAPLTLLSTAANTTPANKNSLPAANNNGNAGQG